MHAMTDPHVHFGGPDKPPRALRDLLEARVDAVPAGGSIDWMTYYFRDEALAAALVRAHQRGVAVRVCVDGRPRRGKANDRVVAILRRGIGRGLRVVRHMGSASHLHTKLYAFSAPHPHVLVGSFNPSGNEPEDNPWLMVDIGDQDRGHNLLVELAEPRLVAACVARVAAVHRGSSPFGLLALPRWSEAQEGDYRLVFFPRFGSNPLDRCMHQLEAGATLRIAASHVRDARYLRLFSDLVERGVEVTLLTHHTRRRSPEKIIRGLRAAGVRVFRYEQPEQLPMHDKFMLADGPGGGWSAFGSFNLKRRSRWLNQELLVIADDEELHQALDRHWRATLAEPWCRE